MGIKKKAAATTYTEANRIADAAYIRKRVNRNLQTYFEGYEGGIPCFVGTTEDKKAYIRSRGDGGTMIRGGVYDPEYDSVTKIIKLYTAEAIKAKLVNDLEQQQAKKSCIERVVFDILRKGGAFTTLVVSFAPLYESYVSTRCYPIPDGRGYRALRKKARGIAAGLVAEGVHYGDGGADADATAAAGTKDYYLI